jgi:4-hydroxybenzoate polyprenyltransferase/phosphoserine phosphatase
MASSDSATALASLHDDGALARPLCVSLDGTLVSTDTLWESVLLMLRTQPQLALFAPFWLLSGKARFKRAIAERVALDVTALPYRRDLIDALKQSRASGRRLVLATASDSSVAESVAAHLGIFDEVHGSDGQQNLKAGHKRERLVEAFGPGGFDYIGGGNADMTVFDAAGRGYLVSAGRAAAARATRHPKVTVVSRRPAILRALIKELRVHQWAKNALVLLPVVLAPGVPSGDVVLRALLAALAFSLCASAGYVFNDLLDVEADRVHATKHTRPFASGALPVLFGPPLFLSLIGLSFGLAAALLPGSFSAMLGIYFVGTLSYSLHLKRRLLLDVFVLAGLYTHRILSGGVVTGVPISAWLLAFSMFLFLSLAFAKRYVELAPLVADAKIKNRDYYRVDLEMVGSMGTGSGYLAALVLSLYVESGVDHRAYREPALLWAAIPILLYWVSRVWIITGRGQMQDDPVKFALKDRTSLVCGLLMGGAAALARFTPDWLSALIH